MAADFQELRTKMVDNQIRTTDVTDLAVIDAFLTVPREAFVPAARQVLAYIDEDQLLESEGKQPRYLMEPSPFAKLVQLARIKETDVVLDVGCGTGYSAAILSKLSGSVIGLENDSVLSAAATARLAELGYDNVVIVSGELQAGYPSEAPYDVIVIEGAVDFVPDALLSQLKDGGRLVAVEGRGNAGVARIYVKENGVASGRGVFNTAVRPLPGFERIPQFEF
ncbi:protein-L-isoaspartate O-methyltransferase family protein [Brucella pecoris]|uniref:Protein-L-isoaspartate O-methyltransferase n=1 Tax=Brucella pecoris TaxID=867683 RepID=A0A5C5CSW4_9HYPH|nr:protein-L-isoaspartate O-methyltransferase [Brucella pecoris]MBB4092557.1 protein-L-isoaspartate(D-aspartate) O-methyltransferase [Brucella pecoris]TNV14383.1 protein-L-isoaspartate O-methyltransferase [Brucella pecoris]